MNDIAAKLIIAAAWEPDGNDFDKYRFYPKKESSDEKISHFAFDFVCAVVQLHLNGRRCDGGLGPE